MTSSAGLSSERAADAGDGAGLRGLHVELIGLVRGRLFAAVVRVRPVGAGQRRQSDAERDVRAQVQVVDVVHGRLGAVGRIAGATRELVVVLAAPVDEHRARTESGDAGRAQNVGQRGGAGRFTL